MKKLNRYRHRTRTSKVITDFGPMYFHIEFDDFARAVGGWISTPGKEPDSQIHLFVEALSAGINLAIKRGEDIVEGGDLGRAVIRVANQIGEIIFEPSTVNPQVKALVKTLSNGLNQALKPEG